MKLLLLVIICMRCAK